MDGGVAKAQDAHRLSVGVRAMVRSVCKAWLVLAALALAAWAVGQERVYRVGYLSWQDEGTYHDVTLRGFLEGLRGEGFVEGKNLQLVRRSASNNAERFKPLANDLARIPVDLYFAPATAMATAAWYADKKTPIVIATIMDPVELKFVHSLARPGTRVTGVTTMNQELTVKRLQLLMEMVPGLKRVGVVVDEAMREACSQEMDHALKAAKQLGLTIVAVHIDKPELLDTGFKKLVDAKVQAVTSTLLSTRNNLEREYAEAALRYKLPSMFEQEIGARYGGLMSYGPDFEDVFRRAGRYAGRVLKGANPAELAMEEPRQFRLVLNLKTARELGVAIPHAVRLRADEVIE
jgi:putative tryptophan/tyrosine transport system substrate-binding protein